VSYTSNGCKWCGATFTADTELQAEARRIDHEAGCSKNPANQ
jgi:hypothetical protein